MRKLLGVATIFISSIASAKLPVDVEHIGDDIYGNQLVYQIKEGLRASHGLTLARPGKAPLIIEVITTDPGEQKLSTAASVVWLMPIEGGPSHIFQSHTLTVCGNKQIKACADAIVARTDEIATKANML